MTVDTPAPLLSALGELAAPVPGPARDDAIRARCHALMTARPHTRQRLPRRGRSLIIDILVPATVVIYGLATLTEALTIAGML